MPSTFKQQVEELQSIVESHLGAVPDAGCECWALLAHELSRFVERETGVAGGFTRIRECDVRGCPNTSDVAPFSGSICVPCREFLRTERNERFRSSRAYQNTVDFAARAMSDVVYEHFTKKM